VETFTDEVLGMLCGPYLNACIPRELDEHVPRTLVVGLYDSSILAEPELLDEIAPDDSELFLTQVIRRCSNPIHPIRKEQLRLQIPGGHRRLPKSTSTHRTLEPSFRRMICHLPHMRLVTNALEQLVLVDADDRAHGNQRSLFAA
jgi:hypothetical protein